MKRTNKTQHIAARCLSILTLTPLVSALNAATLLPLESRLNGQAYYDPNLDITWYSNADLIGESDLAAASVAVNNLVVDGISGWRLPITDRNRDGIAEDCKGKTIDTCTLDNELSFMLNIRGIAATSPGPFTNLRADWYWSVSNAVFNPPRVYAWLMNSAGQSGFGDAHPDNIGLRSWAVHTGDVAVVPVPAAIWLFGSGLLALAGSARRRTRRLNRVSD